MGVEGDWLLAAAKAAPALDPSWTVGVVASAPDKQTAVTNAGAVNGFGSALALKKTLEGQDAGVAHSTWQSLPMDEQAALVNIGYRPAAAPQHHGGGGIFGAIGHAVGAAAGAVVHADNAIGNAVISGAKQDIDLVGGLISGGDKAIKPLGAADHAASVTAHAAATGVGVADRFLGVSKVAGDVASDANKPLSELQHWYRAGALITDQTRLAGHSQFDPFHGAFSPGEWMKAWQNSANGNATFSPVEIRKAEQLYGTTAVTLAKRLASGADVSTILAGQKDPQKQAELAQYMSSDKNFLAAKKYVEASHISLGRRLVPTSLAVSDPLLHKVLSGGIDAVGDWYADPLVHGLGAVKEASTAYYAVQGEEGVMKAFENQSAVRREFTDVANKLADRTADGKLNAMKLASEKPSWAAVATDLARADVSTPREVAQWFASTSGQAKWLSGEINGVRSAERIVPHMSAFGERTQEIKNMAKGAIDWSASSGIPVINGGGEFVKKLVTQLPKSTLINAASASDSTKVMQIARQFLDEQGAQNIGNLWAHAPDMGARRNILSSLYQEIGDTLGMTPDNSRFLKSLKEELAGRGGGVIFSPSARDRLITDAGEVRSPFLPSQLSDTWSVPAYQDWLTAANKGHFFGLNDGGFDTFMSSYWRPAMILRPAFALRAGGEELVQAMMRYSPKAMAQSRLALSALSDRNLTPLHWMYESLTGHLPEEWKAALDGPRDLAASVIGDNARHALRNIEGKLAGERYLNAARRFMNDPSMMDSFARNVSAAAHGVATFNPMDVGYEIKKGGVWVPAHVTPTRQFARYLAEDPEFNLALQMNYRHIAEDPWSKTALHHLGDADGGIGAVAAEMSDPKYDAIRSEFQRSTQTADGLKVGVDASPQQIIDDWARVVTEHAREMVTGANGEISPDIARMLRNGHSPDVEMLRGLSSDAKPLGAVGPRFLPVSDNVVRDIVDKGFAQMIGRPMDWMVRQPMFLHNYAVAEEQILARAPELIAQNRRTANAAAAGMTPEGDWLDKQLTNDELEALRHRALNQFTPEDIHRMALKRAVDDTIPFIHDPRQRSQFAAVTRNIFPFWFAQEQSYKRFARTLAFSPQAFRQAQLVIHGLEHSGFVQKDNQGRDIFHFPGSGLLQEVLSPGLNAMFGEGASSLPVQVGFSGQVQGLNPAIDRLGVPGVGPLISTPLNMLAKRFPELNPTDQAVLGPKGAGRAWWQSLLPSFAVNAIGALNAHTETSTQMLSATNAAIAQLESSGHGLDPSATPEQYDAWIGKVKQWARGILMTRALLGLVSPTVPTAEIGNVKLNPEFNKLISTVGYQQGIRDFIALHPGADVMPFTVSLTKGQSGGPIPSTKGALNFMMKNASLLTEYPKAGAWLIPLDPGKWDATAFHEQLLLDLRNGQQPADYIKAIQFAKDKTAYFDARDQRDNALKKAKGDTAWTRKIEDNWTQWSNDYKSLHRLFGDTIDNPQGKQNRAGVLTELRRTFDDPRLPATSQTKQVRLMVQAYDQYQQLRDSVLHRHDAGAKQLRDSYATIFTGWAKDYVDKNPNVSAFYHAIIEPDVKVSAP